VQSDGHYRLLRDAVEAETDLMVLGYLRPDASVTIPDRHLGLRTAIEQGQGDLYGRLARSAEDTVDLVRMEALARSAGEFFEGGLPTAGPVRDQPVRVGLAYDAAFCFYYQDNLDLLECAGAEIVKFSPMRDAALPDVDLLYFGGGYPELYAEALTGNVTMRRAVRQHAERDGAVYAECGGLMYLTQAIRDCGGGRHEMVGIFPAEAVMRKSGMTLGYRTVEMTRSCLLGEAGTSLRGHEFHYSMLEPKGDLHYACTLSNADGEPVGRDGLMKGNTLALYSHQHFASRPEVVTDLLTVARRARPSAGRKERMR
jgi:cobyrinic acid a,c-diamide synthase